MTAKTPPGLGHQNIWTRTGGPLLTLGMIGILVLTYRTGLEIPNPPAFLVLAIVYSAYAGGLVPGLASAVLACIYTCYFFSVPGQILHFSDENLRRIIVWGITMPAIAILVGTLKRHAERTYLWQDLLEQFFKFAPDAVVMVDRKGRIAHINDQTEKIFGYSPAELIGEPVEMLIPARLSERHKQHRDGYMAHPHSRPMGCGLDMNGRRKDGSEFPVDVTLGPLHTREGPLVLSIVRDITEHKQAREEIRQLNTELHRFKDTLDQTLECVFMFRPDTLRFTYVNEGAKRQTGYSESELMQMTPVDIKPEFTLERFQQMLQPLIDGVQPLLTFQTVHRHKNGHDTPVEIFLQLIRMEGQNSRFVAMVNDISERKQAEENIRQLNINLERRVLERTTELHAVNRELEAFSYSISHDLRAPLRSIDGFSQALLEDYAGQLDDRARDYLNRVRGATQHMGHLIDDMLTLSRVTRAEMRRETVDLSALAADVLAELQKSEPERKVDWRIESGLVAVCDERLLRVALVNLLGNAWKFTGKTANAKIEFGSMRNAPIPNAQGTMEFFVRDNGAGFDMAYAGKLFDAFQRLHLSSEFPGTGVGLATVQRIVHRHGGQVRGESVPGQGATFYFTLHG